MTLQMQALKTSAQKSLRGKQMRTASIFVVGIAAAWLNYASAQQSPSTSAPRSKIECEYLKKAQGKWADGGLEIAAEDFKGPGPVFSEIDRESGRATKSQAGSDYVVSVQVLVTAKGLTFIEITPTGNFAMTTVFTGYRLGDGAFPFVDSRHLDFGADFLGLFPSQAHGLCRIVK